MCIVLKCMELTQLCKVFCHLTLFPGFVALVVNCHMACSRANDLRFPNSLFSAVEPGKPQLDTLRHSQAFWSASLHHYDCKGDWSSQQSSIVALQGALQSHLLCTVLPYFFGDRSAPYTYKWGSGFSVSRRKTGKMVLPPCTSTSQEQGWGEERAAAPFCRLNRHHPAGQMQGEKLAHGGYHCHQPPCTTTLCAATATTLQLASPTPPPPGAPQLTARDTLLKKRLNTPVLSICIPQRFSLHWVYTSLGWCIVFPTTLTLACYRLFWVWVLPPELRQVSAGHQ